MTIGRIKQKQKNTHCNHYDRDKYIYANDWNDQDTA